jgi:hypothetical protein
MASSPTPQPQTSDGSDPSQGQSGGADPSQQGSIPEPIRMIAAITQLAQQVAQAVAPVAPDMQTITQAAQSAIRKIVSTQQSSPQATPPY